MFTIRMLQFSFLILLSTHLFQAKYVPPEALVEPLKPVGVRVSIPNEKGITLVAFHIKFNDAFNGLEVGTIARDITQHKNGRWTYEDRSTKLERDDIIYYWVHVTYNGLGYNLINQKHRVTDFYDYKGQIIESSSNTDNSSNKNQPCVSSTTKLFDPTGASQYPCTGQLLFEEHFKNITQFKRMHWTIVEQFSDAPDYEFVVYRDSHENINVENGLKITPKLLKIEYGDSFIRRGSLTLEKCTGRLRSAECYREARGWNILPPITSSRINTKKSINFEYGRIEIKAKLPRGDWIYPLLLLEPVRHFEENPLETVQIRIASAAGNSELKSQNGSDISGHILWGGISGMNSQKYEDRINDDRTTKFNRELWSDNVHIYELIWSPNRIILKVDGQSYEDKQVDLPSDTPFYLTIGLAVGGLSEFPDNCISRGYKKSWRNIEAKALHLFYNTTPDWYKTWQDSSTTLEVNYVKIWAL